MSIWPVAIAAALPLATIAAREIQRRVQPVRLELARRGEAMLRRSDVSDDVKASIGHMLETAFGMRGKLFASFFAAPVAAVLVVLSSRVRGSLAETMRIWGGDPEYRELDGLHTSIMLANNPLLVPVVAVWVAIWLAPALGLARLFDRQTPRIVDGGAIIRLVEQKYAHAA